MGQGLDVEASALPPSVALARTRLALGAPLLRLRSDEQLVSLFRGGSEEAFRAIHDRYRQRMFAYTRQMLSGSAIDAEDAVQEIFVRAYSGLRSSDRALALRAWLYRIAHNRCIDELRRPQSVATETIPATVPNAGGDPVVRLEQRDALRRLIADVQRLPDQQRSALLMRELAGMTYADVAGALCVSVPAVKSLLVRARVGLAQANEARDTACARIREDLIVAHDRGVRASGLARRHLRDCPHCRRFRTEVRGVSRQLAAFVPALGPIGVIAKVLGIGGGGGAAAGTGAIAGSGATATAAATTAAGGLAGSSAVVGLGAIASSGHVVTLLAAAVVTAGGAIELQHITPPPPQRVHHHHAVTRAAGRTSPISPRGATTSSASSSDTGRISTPTATSSPTTVSSSSVANPLTPSNGSSTRAGRHHPRSSVKTAPLTLTETLNPDHWSTLFGPGTPPSLVDPTTPPSGTSPTSGSASTPGSAGSTPTADPNAPASTAGTPSSTPVSTTPPSSTSTTATGTPAGSATSGSTASGSATAGTTGTQSGSSSTAGSSSGTNSTTGGTRVTKVTPANSTGSIDPSKLPAASRPHGHGTIAVFTMTGN
jgi:RNA polymerase sigma factor (sigma-70 family)